MQFKLMLFKGQLYSVKLYIECILYMCVYIYACILSC